MRREHPEYDLLPSEYFRRQIYGCFWFERDTALDARSSSCPDNILYETDFPHPTSMSPGPVGRRATRAVRRARALEVPGPVLRKILHDNAAKVYRLD